MAARLRGRSTPAASNVQENHFIKKISTTIFCVCVFFFNLKVLAKTKIIKKFQPQSFQPHGFRYTYNEHFLGTYSFVHIHIYTVYTNIIHIYRYTWNFLFQGRSVEATPKHLIIVDGEFLQLFFLHQNFFLSLYSFFLRRGHFFLSSQLFPCIKAM